jgi:hypothetical protein
MGTRRYDLADELRGSGYRSLLTASLPFCNRAVLVVPAREAGASELAIETLRQFVAFEFEAAQWPGTITWGDPATVYWLSLSAACAAALGAQVEGLYDWDMQRGQPEDLALLREDGGEFLVSVAHERESWMWLTNEERTELCERVPELASLLVE